VEVARFNALMAIHFRAVCRVTKRLWMVLKKTRKSSVFSPPLAMYPMDRTDPADELGDIFGALRERPPNRDRFRPPETHDFSMHS
jgi:hypothetical protein